jgi:hypothetical protein
MIKFRSAILALLIVAIPNWLSAEDAAPSSGFSNLKLKINPSDTSVAGGTATLTVGTLSLKNGIYTGDYQIKIVPYVFKNEKGSLSILAPEEDLQKWTNGEAVDFSGKAIETSSKKITKVNGHITPSGKNHGSVTLWFMAGKRKLTFTTLYRLD